MKSKLTLLALTLSISSLFEGCGDSNRNFSKKGILENGCEAEIKLEDGIRHITITYNTFYTESSVIAKDTDYNHLSDNKQEFDSIIYNNIEETPLQEYRIYNSKLEDAYQEIKNQ